MTRSISSLLLATALVAVAGCAGVPPPPKSLPATPSPQQEILSSPSGQGGRVFRDGNDRAYMIRKLPKIEGRYEYVRHDTIRYSGYAVYDVAREDASFFYVKIYQPVPVANVAVAAATIDIAPPALTRTN